MVTSALIRRTPKADNNVRGVDFDMNEIREGLSSPLIDVPGTKDVEKKLEWLQMMIAQRKRAIANN